MGILRKSRSVLVAIIVLCWNCDTGHCFMNSSMFDIIILTLDKNIRFMYERPMQLNVDAIFGVNFAEAHTTSLLQHKNAVLLSQENRRMLYEISEQCTIIRDNPVGQAVLSMSAFKKMVRPEIWNHTILWNHGGFRRTVSPGLTRDKATFIIHQGTPKEAESSRCLEELVKGTEDFVCAVSKKCAEMLVRNDTPRGYPLTHRLLYIQTAIALRCTEHSEMPFGKLKWDYCAAIFQDLVDLEAANFPPPSTDLAMEQILLCGMEGYLEFVNTHYAKMIASWPKSHGCYSALGFRGGNKRRGRRSTSLMDYGCDNHASGVAAASLALLIRAAVENNAKEIAV